MGRVVKLTRHGGLFQSNPRLWIVLFCLKLSIRILWWLFLNFWWFEQSRFNVFIFLSLHCQPVSCHCQQKKSGALLLALLQAAGAFFASIFQTQHSYLRYSKREVKYFYVIPFRIACYTHKHNKNSKLSTKGYF